MDESTTTTTTIEGLGPISEEIDAAVRFRDAHLTDLHEIAARYAGPGHHPSNSSVYDPEAFHYEFVSLALPRMAYEKPLVTVSSLRPMAHMIYATRMAAAIESWSTLTDVRVPINRLALDMLLGYGVAMVVPRPLPWFRDGGPNGLPRIIRVSPAKLVMDPEAGHWTEARFLGHEWSVPLPVLQKYAEKNRRLGWDPAEVAKLTPGNDTKSKSRHSRIAPDRNEVTVYQLWVPDDKAGMIHTFAAGREPGSTQEAPFGQIRAPRRFIGPESGPYVLFGAYDVPEDPYPLSPLAAVKGQIQEVNDEHRKINDAIAEYRRKVLVDGAKRDLAEAIADPLQVVEYVEGLTRDAVVPIEIGGVTPQMLEHLRGKVERLDRVSGMTETMRGNVSADTTATEASIAEGNSQNRQSFPHKNFAAALSRCYQIVAWYLHHDRSINLPLGDAASKVLGETDAVWSKAAGVERASFDDLVLEIDAMSMSRPGDPLRQRRAQDLLTIAPIIANAVTTQPAGKWDVILRDIGRDLGRPLETYFQLQPQRNAPIGGAPIGVGTVPVPIRSGAPGMPVHVGNTTGPASRVTKGAM